MEVRLNSRVSLFTKLPGETARCEVFGTVKYLGSVKFADGIWVGVNLDKKYIKYARNDGSVQGVRYFSCTNEASGLFVKPSAVKLLENEQADLLNQINSIKDKLEISEVEREVLSQLNSELEKEVHDLKLTLKSLDHLNISTHSDVNQNQNSIDFQKLQIELSETKATAQIKETELIKSIEFLKLELSEVYNNLSLLNTQFDKTTTDLNQYQDQNNLLKEQLGSLEPGSTELIIEKLTQKISDCEDELIQKNQLISQYHKKEKQSKLLELEFSSTFESLNTLITDLNNQLMSEISKCSDLEKKLLASSEIIKSLKLLNNSQSPYIEDSSPFRNLLKITDLEFCDLITNSQLPSKSIILLKKLINVKEISSVMMNERENLKKWQDTYATCSVYITSILRVGSLDLKLNKIDQFLHEFWLLSEEINPVKYISDLNPPFYWNDKFELDQEIHLINLEKLKYVLSLEKYDDFKQFQGILTNEYLNKIILNCEKKEIQLDLSQLETINFPLTETIDHSVEIPNNFVDNQLDILKHKISILETKLHDEQKLQTELTKLNKDLDTKEVEKTKLILSLKSIEDLQIETQINYKNAKKLLNKFGIDPIKNEVINELQIIDNMKLVNMVETQRELISNMTPKLHEFSDNDGDIEWLNEWPDTLNLPPLEKYKHYSKTINTLIDINLMKSIDSSKIEQCMLSYLSN